MSFRSGGRGGGWTGGGRGGGGGGGGGQWNGGGGNRGGGGGGGWGNQGGNRGNDGWQNQGNRYNGSQHPPPPHHYQHQQQGGGGGRGGGGGSSRPQETPEEAVRNDLQTEKPIWLLSCYSHAREGANDLTGDVSFEEVRWSNLQDLRAHRTPLSINADFKGAVRAKQEEFNALLARARDRRGGALPSLGGQPIHVQNAWLAQFLTPGVGQPQPQMGGGFGAPGQPQPGGFGFGQAAQPQLLPAAPGGFGTAPTGFGQPAPTAGFGQPAAAVGFGQPAAAGPAFAQAGGFGAAPGGGFGAPPQMPQTGFGHPAPGAPFGQPGGGGFQSGGGGFGAAAAGPAKGSWAGQGSFGGTRLAASQAPATVFGQSVGAQPAAPNAFMGGGFVPTPAAGQQALPGFTQPAGTSGPLQGFGSPAMVAPAVPGAPPFGMAPAAAAPAASAPATEGGATAAGGGATAGPREDELQAFKAATFTLGTIPEVPPPPELCY